MIQTFSFHLPSNSGLVASVITPTIQKEVTYAVLAAITLASGQAPSNMTVVPTFSTSSSDGSITITFLIDSTLSKIVNTTIFISADTYAADPIGSTALAVKSASGGNRVQGAAVSLTTAARQASVSVCALVDTNTTTSTKNTLVSRIANVIHINASSIEATGVCALVENAIVSDSFGTIVGLGIGGNVPTTAGRSTGTSLSELLENGGIATFVAALVAALMTAFFIFYYLFVRRRFNESANTTSSSTTTTTNLISGRGGDKSMTRYQQNPLRVGVKTAKNPLTQQNPLLRVKKNSSLLRGEQPKPPPIGRSAPKHSFASSSSYDDIGKPKSSSGGVSVSLALATTENPMRQ
jgi:hypothetical protein